MRTQATIRNALWGILQQAVLCVLGLLSRRVMLQTIGVSGVGLNGLLTNVLSLLSLTEMGVGSVIIYHMYTPLANGDWEEICRLMRFYRNVYRGIALVMTGAGLLLVPFLPYLVNGVHYSQSYVTAVFLLFWRRPRRPISSRTSGPFFPPIKSNMSLPLWIWSFGSFP